MAEGTKEDTFVARDGESLGAVVRGGWEEMAGGLLSGGLRAKLAVRVWTLLLSLILILIYFEGVQTKLANVRPKWKTRGSRDVGGKRSKCREI